MPFCTQCGTRVDEGAFYCAQCGYAQPRANSGDSWTTGATSSQAAAPAKDFLSGMNDRTASILCYIPVIGIVPSIVFLASQRFRHNRQVRFNAFQSMYLFVAFLVFSSLGHNGLWHLVKEALSLCWIFLLVKAAQNSQVHLPIVGDLAARSASEQA